MKIQDILPQEDVPWYEYFDFWPADDEGVAESHKEQSLALAVEEENEHVFEYVPITRRPNLLTCCRETPEMIAEREETNKRIE